MMTDLERFKSMESYTFDEGVAFLRICDVPQGVIGHLQSTHNRNNLHAEIHKTLRMPGTMRLLKEKGVMRHQAPSEAEPKQAVLESDGIDPNEEEHVPENEEPGTGESEGMTITREDVMTHKHTRYDQMPNDITRELYLKKQDLYREMQQCHLKMRNVPEGEEHDGERALYRAEVMRLDKEVEEMWNLIDAEIERFMSENEGQTKGQGEGAKAPSFNISTYRAYISKATRKKKLTEAQLVELQHRVDSLLSAGEELGTETIGKLKEIGIRFGRLS